MAASLLDVLFTARPERPPPPQGRIYATGALLASAVIVSRLAGRRARRAR